MSDDMYNFLMYQGVKDKIAATINTLGLTECSKRDDIVEDAFEDIKTISSAYGLAVKHGYADDIVQEDLENYTTLNFLMDIVIVQSIRVNAAKHGIMTQLNLNLKEPSDDESN